MKEIRHLIMHILLCLSITIVHASELDTKYSDEKLTKDKIEQAINNIIVLLKKEYIYPEKSKLIASELSYKLVTNEFDSIYDWDSFIRKINFILRNVSGDMYLDVERIAPLFMLEESSLENKSYNKNFGINKVEILAANIGYMKLNYFYQNPKAKIAIARALKTLSQVDALIIDLRDAEGESILLAQYLMSFFVEKGTILSEILYDKQKKIKVLSAIENNDNDKFKHDFPLYILTSSFISSSGEYLSYTLKRLDKAIIVGEETMGVAYVQKKLKINEHISLIIPIAIHLTPITHENWSQVGVTPDVDVAAKLSLEAAYKMAKTHLGMF